uniref:DNA polymerase n=7 Tax=Poxviridae sp. TaxID=2717630 RepID=A0A6G8HJ27_9POXV|nr:DNA polymerase [Poxviridae sp.]
MEVKCLNWFETKGNNRLLFLKARTKTNETIFIRFTHLYYYVIKEETKKSLNKNVLFEQPLGKMNLINIDETVYYHANINKKDICIENLWLIADVDKLTINDLLMTEFLHITWFFLINNINPNGYYKLNIDYLTLIRKGCYHCTDPKLCFLEHIDRFEITKSCLFFDIECQFEKKFPSVFINPVSHVSCCYIDKLNNEYKFNIINIDLLSEDDKKNAMQNFNYIKNYNDMDYSIDITFCSEITLLKIMKKILETNFDFIVTFNGHNFDIRYLSTRLTLLTNEKITFKLPDKSEIIYLNIYERNLASHKGVGGIANTTYHVNNNNGTIYFDLYSYIQKSDKLDSYKLDSISKHAFSCKAKAINIDDKTCEFIGDNTTDSNGKANMFSNVLVTGNYITINDIIFKIINKTHSIDKFSVIVHVDRSVFNPENNEIYELSFGKDDVNLEDMYKNFTLDISIEMAKYCLHDATLCKHLWKHYGIETKIGAAASTYILPQCSAFEYRASTLIKGPLLKLLLETKTVMIRSNTKNKFPYEGGKVFQPKKKMFNNNVLIYDYNSLYPNVCIYGNLSPETLVGVVLNSNKLEETINKQLLKKIYPYPNYITVECEPRSSNLVSEIAIFNRQHRGIIPKLLLTFLEERARYKKLYKTATSSTDKEIFDSMQYMYKIIANSVYGLMGFKNSALYSYSSAKSCTSIGRTMILYIDKVLNGAKLNNGILYFASDPIQPFSENKKDNSFETSLNNDICLQFNSVYGDTDSVFLEIDTSDIKTSLQVAKELEKIINGYLLFDNFKIEFEAIYKNLIMQSKKKYTTWKISANDVDESKSVRINKGTSETRRDVSKYHKMMIKKYKTYISTTLSENKLTTTQVCVDTLQSLENDLMLEFETRHLPIDMFLLSRMHHCNYKLSDNPNMALVNKYNSENAEIIEIGSRYSYIYVCDINLPWQKKLTNIKSFERIVDKSFKLENQRIAYEIYFKRLVSEVINLLDNKLLSIQFFEKLFGTKPLFY